MLVFGEKNVDQSETSCFVGLLRDFNLESEDKMIGGSIHVRVSCYKHYKITKWKWHMKVLTELYKQV